VLGKVTFKTAIVLQTILCYYLKKYFFGVNFPYLLACFITPNVKVLSQRRWNYSGEESSTILLQKKKCKCYI